MDEIETKHSSDGGIQVQVQPPEISNKKHDGTADTELPYPLFDDEFEMTIDRIEPIVSQSPVRTVKRVTPSKSSASDTSGMHKLNESTESTDNSLVNTTTETEGSTMILDHSMELGNSSSALSRINLSTEIFSDALDQLTDIAVAAGIVTADKPSSSNTNVHANMTSRNSDEPGKITSARNSFDEGETQPFDEDEPDNKLDISLPFDEMPTIGRKHPEEMSAITRMRFQKRNDTLEVAKNEPQKSSDGKSYEEIQKEKHEKWRNLRQHAKGQEAEIMQMQERGEELVEAISEKHPSPSPKPRPSKSVQKSESSPVRVSNAPTKDDLAFIDISAITKPIEDVWNQSQAALMEVVLGNGNDDDDIHSEYSKHEDSDYDDDSCSSASSYYSDWDEESEMSGNHADVARGRKSRRRRGHENDIDSDDDSELDNDDENSDAPHSSEGGSNRNFLDEITSEGIHLTWHQPRSSSLSKESASEVIVHMQISDGEGDGRLSEPNIVWEIVTEGRNPRKSKHCEARRESISLFDISTIQKAADSIKLSAFPFANPFNSIMLSLHDGSVFLFEAESASEAKQIMHGLRWIEARFTFNIIVGNAHVCSEMMSTSGETGVTELTSDIFLDVTDQLIEKSLKLIA
jgi:hypothetical protein